jgi:hypothetical protein
VKKNKQLSLFIVLCTLGLILLYPRGNENKGGKTEETDQKALPTPLDAVGHVANGCAKNIDHQAAERSNWLIQNRIACWALRFNFFTFAVSIIAAIIAVFAYKAAVEANRTQNRPWVSISGNKVSADVPLRFGDTRVSTQISFMIKNGGNSTAAGLLPLEAILEDFRAVTI